MNRKPDSCYHCRESEEDTSKPKKYWEMDTYVCKKMGGALILDVKSIPPWCPVLNKKKKK